MSAPGTPKNRTGAPPEMLAADYGYDKYGGNCHMVPNHGLIIHSLLHGEDDFSETMKIINTCGWDTDCNSGNVGCLMGIKNGIQGIDLGLNKGLTGVVLWPTGSISRRQTRPGAFQIVHGKRLRLLTPGGPWPLKNCGNPRVMPRFTLSFRDRYRALR